MPIFHGPQEFEPAPSDVFINDNGQKLGPGDAFVELRTGFQIVLPADLRIEAHTNNDHLLQAVCTIDGVETRHSSDKSWELLL